MLNIVGRIATAAAVQHPDDQVAVFEGDGSVMLADARDAPGWLGLGFGGRWKTWVLGPLSTLPMIPWPRFDRFHQHQHEAEQAHQALLGAVQKAMVGAPLRDLDGAGDSPNARYTAVYPQQPGDGSGNFIGVVMMDECSDWDFSVHYRGQLLCLRGGNYGGPRMVSYRPVPGSCTVATAIGINDRIDLAAVAAEVSARFLGADD